MVIKNLFKKEKKPNKIKKSTDERVFTILNYTLLTVILILCLYPIFFIVINSVSRPIYVISGEVWIYPKGFTLATYKEVFGKEAIWQAFGNSVFYTFGATVLNVIFTTIAAYFLSRKPKGYIFFLFFILINMWFKAGTIPSYLNYVRLGLLTDVTAPFATILGSALDVFNVIVMKSFFDAIPKEMEESAVIDGANSRQILTKIHLPLSKTAITTIAVFAMVSEWNSYFWPMILYMTRENRKPLPVLIKKWVIDQTAEEYAGIIITKDTLFSQDTFIYATVIFAMIPMVIIYPFVQKFFQKGVMIGSIKG